MKYMQKDKVIEILLVAIFLAVLFISGIKNFSIFYGEMEKIVHSQTIEEVKPKLSEAESQVKLNYSYGRYCKDLYGIGLNLLNKNVVGNFEFIRDEDGYMQLQASYDFSTFENSMEELYAATQEKGIPLFLVNLPEASSSDKLPIADYMGINNMGRRSTVKSLAERGIDVINIESEDFYFKTDIHPTTDGEFMAAQLICNYLENKGIKVDSKEKIFNKNNYTKKSFDFLGNLGTNTGVYYTGTDIFDMYFPNFDTSFELNVLESGVHKVGDWKSVITNGFDEVEPNVHIYYVVNFLYWPNPIYKITNHLSAGPRILYVSDSCALRTMAYMSLCCSEITVVDTRYSVEKNYLNRELQNGKYDAVIVQGNSPEFYNTKFNVLSSQITRDYDFRILESNLSNVMQGTENQCYITVINTGIEEWSADSAVKLMFWTEAGDVGARSNLSSGIVVKQGEQFTFEVDSNVIDMIRNYSHIWIGMVKEGEQYFIAQFEINNTDMAKLTE